MRIISGIHKGRQLTAPKTLPVRPTTDYAKSGLFNMLASRYNFKKLKVVDLFAGTGSITYEFLSRGCEHLVAVDNHPACIKFINSTLELLQAPKSIMAIQSDALTWLKKTDRTFDIIFADAPFDQTPAESLAEIVFERNLLNKNGVLIIEHGSANNLSPLKNYIETRKYSQVSFSFFKNEADTDIT
ncbi:MAG: RsmD family RNA methyltransferase [Bacteroidetes bacterium]|nr:RsmD family RNA methyltransferase [Bacteroidota bacterium]MBL0097714.1 RsmD family RNA methyltransferase [Bacteroidota bacterium]